MKGSGKFSRSLVGDFTFDIDRERRRHRLFLSRNMKKVLVRHESYRARTTNSGGTRPPLTNGYRESSNLGSFNRSSSYNRQTVPKNESNDTSKSNGMTNGTLGNGVIPLDDYSQPPDSVTSKPWLHQVSKSCLVVTADSDKYDTPNRRSRRNQSDAYQDRGAELTLNPRNIRKKLNFKSNLPADFSGDERPRKRAKRNAIECQCHVTVWDNREGTSGAEPLVKRSQTCYLTARDGLVGGHVVDLEFNMPITIKAAELEVSLGEKGKQSIGVGDKYFLELKIIPCKSELDWPPIPVLSRSEGELFVGSGKLPLAALQGALVARYMHLPQAPASDIPLSVFFLHGGRAYKTKYGLELNGRWGKPTVTVMQVKEELSEELSEDHLSLSSWAFDEDGAPFGRKLSKEPKLSSRSSPRSLVKPEATVEISYIFDPKFKETSKDSRKATLKGFRCPACRIGEFDSLSELQFHLINSHHKYKFDLDSEDRDPSSGELKALIFNVNSADAKRPKEFKDIKSEWEWNWEAPRKPFEIDAYIKGDHSWVGVQTKKPRNLAAQVLSSDPIMAMRQKSGGLLPADLVPELPKPKRKKYPVVKTCTEDNLPLYSSIDHRRLRLSEEPMSDTDDEVDGEWITEKHLKTIEEVDGLSWGQKDFRMRWDAWRMEEGGAGGAGAAHPRFLSDSLVRFVRQNKQWLRGASEDVFGEFWRFSSLVRERGKVDENILAKIFGIIGRGRGEEKMVNGNHGEREDAQMSDAGLDQPRPTKTSLGERTEELLSLPPDTCGICMKEVRNMIEEMLQCSHYDCDAPGVPYHKACASRPRGDSDWICGLCEERITEWEELRRRKGKGKAIY